MNWDNLKIILTIARTGSFAGAARQLGVDRTTVLRKVKQIQSEIDFELFCKVKGEYILTAGAERILQTAEAVEGHVQSLERMIEGRELRPQGRISITTTDSIFQFVLAPLLARFRNEHPEITLDLIIANHRLSLTRRDADIAIRTGPSVPTHLVGYPMGGIRFGIYASKGYMREYAESEDEDHRWLGVDEPLLSAPPGQWISRNVDDELIVMRTNSFVALCTAVQASIGIAMLPSDYASQHDDLVQLDYDLSEIANRLWCLTHPDLASSGRIMAFVDFLSSHVDFH